MAFERSAGLISRTMSENQLDHLRSMSVVVADTGEISLVQKYRSVTAQRALQLANVVHSSLKLQQPL